MKPAKFFLYFFGSVLFLGCEKSKVAEVFPESQSSLSAACSESVISNEYLVKFKTGETRALRYDTLHSFIANFVTPQLSYLEHVEYHKMIRVTPAHATLNSSTPAPRASTSWGQDIIESAALNRLGFMGQEIVIAVIDTATDITHPALQPQIAINSIELGGLPDVDDDLNGLVDDTFGWDFYWNKKIDSNSEFHPHGTHVSGIIAGNQGGWSGVAPSAKLIPISFMSNDGFGNVASAVNSIRYAKSRGAHIINASWGGPLCSRILEEEIRLTSDAGVLFVAASGNDGLDLDWQPQYPAAFNFPLQLTVAASRPSDFLAGFSNTSFRLVHIAAPGDDIWSTLPNHQFGFLSGTSMAAPFVSGAAAVLMSARPDLLPAQIRRAILLGVDLRSYRVQTSGRLNLRKSLESMSNW